MEGQATHRRTAHTLSLDKPGAEGRDDGVVADEKNEEEEKALSKCGEERGRREA